ncbi:hypothetical protein ACIU1J_24350 [Azospirillum doebereinerae]|uniref:hypothetical protein n=1 Tax=Azospirillum doebereinerae TaxID=92933 RepID=UPI00384BD660
MNRPPLVWVSWRVAVTVVVPSRVSTVSPTASAPAWTVPAGVTTGWVADPARVAPSANSSTVIGPLCGCARVACTGRVPSPLTTTSSDVKSSTALVVPSASVICVPATRQCQT